MHQIAAFIKSIIKSISVQVTGGKGCSESILPALGWLRIGPKRQWGELRVRTAF